MVVGENLLSVHSRKILQPLERVERLLSNSPVICLGVPTTAERCIRHQVKHFISIMSKGAVITYCKTVLSEQHSFYWSWMIFCVNLPMNLFWSAR